MKTALVVTGVLLAALLLAGPASAAPPEPELTTVDLGLVGADCYQVLALAADAAAGRLYALCARGEGGEADLTLVSVDSASGRQLAATSLAMAGDVPATVGHLALDVPAGRLYVLSDALDGLRIVDTDDLRPRGRLPGVRQVVPVSAGGFVTLSDAGLASYSAAEVTPRTSLNDAAVEGAVRLAYNPRHDHLYLAGSDIRALRAADLTLVTTLPITDVQALAVDSRSDRLYVLSGDGRLLAAGGDTLAITTARQLDPPAAAGRVRFLLVDADGGRLHLVGEAGGRGFWQVVEAATLQTQHVYAEFPFWDAAVLTADGGLLAVRDGGEIVQRYDPNTGVPALAAVPPVAAVVGGGCNWEAARPAGEHLQLGRRVVAAAVWPETWWVYALDAGGGLHIMDGARLEVFVDCAGLLGVAHPGLTSPDEVDVVLDTQRGRLYVADRVAGRMHVIDAAALELLGTLPIAGSLALDVAGGRLFVADGDVYILDVTDLEAPPALPDGPAISFEPATARAVVVDGDRLFVHLTDRATGEAAPVWRAFDPATLQEQGDFRLPPGAERAWLAAAPGEGIWVAYDGGESCPPDARAGGLIRFDRDQVAQQHIAGVAGQLWADGDQLIVRRAHDVLVLDAMSGAVLETLTVGDEVHGGMFDITRRQLYVWGWDRLATRVCPKFLDGTGDRHF